MRVIKNPKGRGRGSQQYERSTGTVAPTSVRGVIHFRCLVVSVCWHSVVPNSRR